MKTSEYVSHIEFVKSVPVKATFAGKPYRTFPMLAPDGEVGLTPHQIIKLTNNRDIEPSTGHLLSRPIQWHPDEPGCATEEEFREHKAGTTRYSTRFIPLKALLLIGPDGINLFFQLCRLISERASPDSPEYRYVQKLKTELDPDALVREIDRLRKELEVTENLFKVMVDLADAQQSSKAS